MNNKSDLWTTILTNLTTYEIDSRDKYGISFLIADIISKRFTVKKLVDQNKETVILTIKHKNENDFESDSVLIFDFANKTLSYNSNYYSGWNININKPVIVPFDFDFISFTQFVDYNFLQNVEQYESSNKYSGRQLNYGSKL